MKKFLLLCCILYTVFSLLFNHILVGVGKLLLIPLVVFVISMLGFMLKHLLLRDVAEYTKKERKELTELRKQEEEKQRQEFLKHYDKDIKPLRDECSKLFAELMKTKKMRAYDIKEFKKLLDAHLGEHKNFYHNYKFKNDANEIYVKMKNFALNEYDWEELTTYLRKIQKQNNGGMVI